METFMEVGQGPNWGCSAKEEKKERFKMHVFGFYLDAYYVVVNVFYEKSFGGIY
jgi:hypothetical protein